MIETLVGVSPPSPEKNEDPAQPAPEQMVPPGKVFGALPGAGPDRELTAAELAVIAQMVRQAKDAGVALTGPDGLLKALTKTMTGSCSGNRYARRPPALG
jgi:putative transposase